MNQRGSVLLSLIFASFILISILLIANFGVLTPFGDQTTSVAEQTGITSPGEGGTVSLADKAMKQAQQTKIQADLKGVLTALSVYQAEMGTVPDSLTEIDEYLAGTDSAGIVYTKCSDYTAVFYHNSDNYPGYIFGEMEQAPTSGAPPSC